ncbi:cob(I)yrinic acid a,c-diamide adenosyltransferase [Pollutimonas harenae]|uniref:Cobalamin adenosyltransferase n=1 Tax=Pollutimonas harenae TaxID=657015 RepID=A0A853H2P8_9BURK|nr:cob(I)yrinic acid a,c-diamide adenosyltransferase [Pollutimonas harenae]NYT84843.1 cob(I)yrinic acid a,c-diamide adenosyltransferase [Pollutimonas harenae]TEA72759.1 cob(I)yrinic acid a,c-diamide adenosyltransferase [Pollutimonas harenae]
MATRLSVIATRTGDGGTTGLGDGSRVDKNTPRIEAMGNVDELNSVIGLLRTEALPKDIDALLSRIQNDLFDLGAELCIPGHSVITEEHVVFLDQSLAHYNAGLERLKEFILPGGSRAAALAHLARTVCRRAERSVVTVHATEAINKPVLQYLNRLSDLCFVLARVLNRETGQGDVLWSREPSA